MFRNKNGQTSTILVISVAILLINLKYTSCKKIDDYDSVCNPKSCLNSTIQSIEVNDYCMRSMARIENRCCFNQTSTNDSTIIGLDYTSCGLTELKDSTDSLQSQNATHSVYIFDIRNNSLLECNTQDYENFISLEELYLPDTCQCPGQNYSWAEITPTSCINQINICKTNFTNVNCTKNSECHINGPGNFLCLCKENYHGYKCLEKGTFPTLMFTLTFSLGTLFFCGLLFHTQRRHVVKNDSNEDEDRINEDNERLIEDNDDIETIDE